MLFTLRIRVLLRCVRLTGASCSVCVKLVILVPMLDLLFEIEVLSEGARVAAQSHVRCLIVLLLLSCSSLV